MAISFRKNLAVVSDTLGVEDADALLEWLQKQAKGKIDLSACTHLHCANLQVLMALRPGIHAWPTHPPLARWLQAALL